MCLLLPALAHLVIAILLSTPSVLFNEYIFFVYFINQEDLAGGVNLSRNLSLSKSFREDTKETAIKYGDSIRLYTVSRYTEGIAGGYIGYYLRGGPAAGADGNITSKRKHKGYNPLNKIPEVLTVYL